MRRNNADARRGDSNGPATAKMPSGLTEDNVRKLGGLTLAEQEEQLLAKMQTLSHLLGQVDSALEACPSTRDGSRPPTGASALVPPPSRRGLGSAAPRTAGSAAAAGELPRSAGPPGTASSSRCGTSQQQRVPTGAGVIGTLPGGTAGSAMSSSSRSIRGYTSEATQLAVINETPFIEPKVEFVQYTGQQGGHNVNQGRRRVETSATKSSMGAIFGLDP